ncbi:hypothetical protein NDU88_008605 [Pleurodeles waltl]|uniref:Uncharacterized protein n=1 Tax=Pleurodeles waltl TaxID=8319 RepID=A0AAV7P5J6_PLEWA|nr:hypothetical protein NDU88_008605 [Pleurodeles waltl]
MSRFRSGVLCARAVRARLSDTTVFHPPTARAARSPTALSSPAGLTKCGASLSRCRRRGGFRPPQAAGP